MSKRNGAEMFIVKKKISGNEYYYLQKSVRENGKVKSKSVAYLGKDEEGAKRKAEEIKNMDAKNQDKENEVEVKPHDEKEFLSFITEHGLIWGPEPEIYGGLAGFFTYGPIGKLLKNKVEESVRKIFNANGLRELEGPTIMPDSVWKASGHLDTFKDRTIQCSKCESVFRADKVIEEKNDVAADAFSNEKLLNFIKEKEINCPNCRGKFKGEIETQSLMMKD
jgi:hypothetical protein